MAQYVLEWRVSTDEVSAEDVDGVGDLLRQSIRMTVGQRGTVSRVTEFDASTELGDWAEEQKLAAHEDQKVQDEMKERTE